MTRSTTENREKATQRNSPIRKEGGEKTSKPGSTGGVTNEIPGQKKKEDTPQVNDLGIPRGTTRMGKKPRRGQMDTPR